LAAGEGSGERSTVYEVEGAADGHAKGEAGDAEAPALYLLFEIEGGRVSFEG
jgi:hypothetical protein